jgi:hypothetical protein
VTLAACDPQKFWSDAWSISACRQAVQLVSNFCVVVWSVVALVCFDFPQAGGDLDSASGVLLTQTPESLLAQALAAEFAVTPSNRDAAFMVAGCDVLPSLMAGSAAETSSVNVVDNQASFRREFELGPCITTAGTRCLCFLLRAVDWRVWSARVDGVVVLL